MVKVLQQMSAPSFSVEYCLPELQETVEVISNFESLNGALNERLVWLLNKLFHIREELPLIFTLDVEQLQVLAQLQVLQNGVDAYYTLCNTVDDIDVALSHLLDLIEDNEVVLQYGWKLETFVDLVDDCSNSAAQLRQLLQSQKEVIDTVLEFNEISIDHIDTLETIIGNNIQTCFELQDVRFSSPVRHSPSFTLKELIKVLSSFAESSDVKVPTFSSLEEALCRKFIRLKHSILPIEKSLVEILPQRIDHFSRRNVKNIEYLCSLMEERRQKLSSEHEFMVQEVDQLKIALIDKKWSILFHNLNQELSFIFEELELLQKKILQKEYQQERQQRFKDQLKRKTRTIQKTFDAIEKASDLSLLDSKIDSETEKLSQKWAELKPINERILNDMIVNQTSDQVDSVASKLQTLNVSNDVHPVEIPRKKFGAMLMRKMNIKPVIIAGSPASAEKINPFYDRSPGAQDRDTPEELILHSVPRLSYVDQDDSLEINHEPSGLVPTSLQDLEKEKIRFYSKRKSRIPKFKESTVLPVNFLFSTPLKPSQQWVTGKERTRSLRPPTPISVLLTSVAT